MQKRKWWVGLLLVLALLAVGAGCYLAGRSTEIARSNVERELNVILNRSDLEGLGEIEGPIYVTGHKSPDSDTVGSAIGYARLLQKLGYDAQPVVLGSINHETEYVLNVAGMDAPELLEDASGCNMVLVDHSEYTQSADGLKDATILSIIDHHGDGAITTGNQLIYDARPLGSTATIVWIRYRNYGVELDPQTALVMLGSLLSDTKNLQSNTTTSADREARKVLSALSGISDTNAFYTEMFKASLSYEGMTDMEVFLSDYKEYESGGQKYAIGCINVYDEEGAKDMVERMVKMFPSVSKTDGMDMSFAQIGIFHDDVSVTFLVPSNEAAAEVIQTAFPEAELFEGGAYRIEPGISRKQVLVPAITDILEAHPKE